MLEGGGSVHRSLPLLVLLPGSPPLPERLHVLHSLIIVLFIVWPMLLYVASRTATPVRSLAAAPQMEPGLRPQW